MASEPRHRRISRELLTEIANGKYGPGDRLPSEAQLCQKFGVSRPTVGRALRELQEQGLIDRRVGSGTFVRAPGSPASPSAYRQLGKQLGMRKVCHTEVLQQPPRSIMARECATPDPQQFGHPLKKRGPGQAIQFVVAANLVKSDRTPRANKPLRGTKEIRRAGLVYQYITSNHHIEQFVRRKLLNRADVKADLLITPIANAGLSLGNCLRRLIDANHRPRWPHHLSRKHRDVPSSTTKIQNPQSLLNSHPPQEPLRDRSDDLSLQAQTRQLPR